MTRLKEVLQLVATDFEPELYERLQAREEIRRLCEVHGYGAIMQTASQLWLHKDPVGALTVGPCALTVKMALKEITS